MIMFLNLQILLMIQRRFIEEDTDIQDNNDNIADIFEGGDISIDNVIREAVKDSIEDWFSRNLRPIVEESVKQEISKLFKKRN